LTNITVNAQYTFSIDTLIKKNKVKTMTQFEVDFKTQKDKILYQHQYDTLGRLEKNIEYSGKKPFLTAYYKYNKFNKADSVFRQFTGEEKYLSQLYKFDSVGNLIASYSCFKESGCKIDESYTYIKDNLVLTKTEYSDGKSNIQTTYTYNEKDLPIEEKTSYINSDNYRIVINTYDDKKELTKSVNYLQNGQAVDSTFFEYNENGKLTSLNWNGGLGTKSISKYDSLDNEIEYQSVAFDGQISDRRVMTYDGKLLKTRIHYDNDKVKNNFRFVYDFYK
jgi:hypothetical protein